MSATHFDIHSDTKAEKKPSLYVYWLDDLDQKHRAHLVEHNAGLELVIDQMVKEMSPGRLGFAVTADLCRDFLKHNELDEAIKQLVLEYTYGVETLSSASSAIKKLIEEGHFTLLQKSELESAYCKLTTQLPQASGEVLVNSFASNGDKTTTGFATPQECHLRASDSDKLLIACKQCFAALYNNSGIAYREEQGIENQQLVLIVSPVEISRRL